MAHFEKRGTRWMVQVKSKGGRVSRTFDTKAEAQAWAHMQEGTPGGRKSTDTVGGYLTGWLDTLDRMEMVRPNTLAGYRGKIVTATKSFGHIKLLKLEVDHIDQWLAGLKDRGLSKSTIAQCKTIMSKAMKDAVRSRLIPFNPVDGAKAPKQAGPKKPDVMSIGQAKEYLDRLDSPFMTLLAFTGLRRSEMGGLRWEDINLDGPSLTVAQTLIRKSLDGKQIWITSEPKSRTSARTLPIPAPAVAILRQRQTAQKRDRLAAGQAWVDTGLVFTDGLGNALNLDAISTRARRVMVEMGLTGSAVHGLRHLFGTMQNKIGTDVASIQAMMGHSRASTTLDYYVRAGDDDKADAMTKLGELF